MLSQEFNLPAGDGPSRGAKVARLFILGVVGAVVLLLAFMNLTPGHFDFADMDGCACLASYTTYPSQASCEPTRSLHCDQLWVSRLLVYVAYLDFNK
jgi:hypothetical protein